MSDKMSEVFKEYDMEVLQNTRGRGAVILKTDQGIRQLRSLTESESRLKSEYLFKEALCEAGFTEIDRCIPNRDGDLVTYDRYQNPYVLREFFEGREMGITANEDLKEAVRNLAEFHKTAKRVYENNPEQVKVRNVCDFARKNRELKRVRNFMQKNRLRSFELTYLDHFDYFFSCGQKCEEDYQRCIEGEETLRLGYCHGAYDHHSVLKTENSLATINFDKFYAGNQLADLYHYLRKALEKNKYNFRILQLIIEEYNSQIPLTDKDLEYIYILLEFPEKFYKISNQYMNASKSWIPPKLVEKLDKVIADESKKTNTIFQFRDYYSLHI